MKGTRWEDSVRSRHELNTIFTLNLRAILLGIGLSDMPDEIAVDPDKAAQLLGLIAHEAGLEDAEATRLPGMPRLEAENQAQTADADGEPEMTVPCKSFKGWTAGFVREAIAVIATHVNADRTKLQYDEIGRAHV